MEEEQEQEETRPGKTLALPWLLARLPDQMKSGSGDSNRRALQSSAQSFTRL